MVLINNPTKEDYHIHTSTFSDGKNTAEEIILVAGEIGLEKIAITDHSRPILESYRDNLGWKVEPKVNRDEFRERFQGKYDNGVEVIIGLEADLLDENGNICDYNWDPHFKEDWLVLSAHLYGYNGDKSKVMQGYLEAIKKHGERIKLIGHPYCTRDFASVTDMKELAKAANDHGIAGEINGKCFKEGIVDYKLLTHMLEHFDRIVINSDAHDLKSLRTGRNQGLKYFNKFLKGERLIPEYQEQVIIF
jgi:HisJ family histidinol phosphate phosphatase